MARRLEVGRTPAAPFPAAPWRERGRSARPICCSNTNSNRRAIGDGLPSRVDDRDELQDTPPISRVFDVTVLQVGLADGVDGAAPTA